MFFLRIPGGGKRPTDELNIRDCSSCGKPTVFAKGSRGEICANCAPAPIEEAERPRTCPVDGTSMVSNRRSDVIVDQCPSCHGVWLDANELELIVAATRTHASKESEKAAALILNVLAGFTPSKRFK